MMDDATLDAYAQIAAQQALQQYGVYARNLLNLTKEELKKLIRRTAEHAAKIIDSWPT